MFKRHNTFPVKVGPVTIGGQHPIRIQSMTNTKTSDIETTLHQINELTKAGCELVRVAIPDKDTLKTIPELVERSPIPIIGDIHFDYQLAIGAIKAGVSKVRINPGNIGSRDRVFEIVQTAREYQVPIRIGVNSGSLEKDLLEKYGANNPMALVESAASHLKMINRMGFYDIVVSLKASDVPTTLSAYYEFKRRYANPLHIGITEAGTVKTGTIKSAVGIGSLLTLGVGDTLRVSLSGSPLEEITAAHQILVSLGLRQGVKVIACPTCGRTGIDVEALALEVENRLQGYQLPITVAVMGCVVNGPGEAKEADIGVAGTESYGMLFRYGKPYKKVPRHELTDTLLEEIESFVDQQALS